jgi:adenine-specific DNA-methyltransferase
MKTKLELTWIGKENQLKLEPRILVEDPDLSYHAKTRNGSDIFENMLIFGDNLLALKALEADFCEKVKCIYIDPPYNTGSAFEHYDDGVEHSIWLSLMRDRLLILRRLLCDDGFIFVQIDNNEMAYLKVLMDEIFGRGCFINDIVWKRRGGSANPNNRLNNVTDYILWYSKTPNVDINQLYSRDDENTQNYIAERFKGVLDGRRYMLAPIERNAKLGMRETLRYEYNGYIPEYGWMMSRENLVKLDSERRLHWNGKGRPNRRVFEDDYQGQPIGNLWTDIKVINPMATERLDFDGQKPEALIQRILQLTTSPGDLVLDSFGGTGTTAAVSHKMGRKWITIELGDHCHTYILPRLRKLINGEDKGGITESVNWKGGGGFRYYRLAPSLLERDKWGRWVICKDKYNPAMLAEALCKLEGFRYEPSDSIFWMHGRSSEQDYLYATTQTLSHEQLQALSAEVGPNRSLLILCAAFRGNANDFPNLTLKKIPTSIWNKCEWGHDDYSLKVENLPLTPERSATAPSVVRKGKARASNEPDLFGEAGA